MSARCTRVYITSFTRAQSMERIGSPVRLLSKRAKARLINARNRKVGVIRNQGIILASWRLFSGFGGPTVVITNLSPLTPFTVIIGRGEYPNLRNLQELIRKKTSRLIAFNAVSKAKEAGNVLAVNMVLLGALSQTGLLPFTADYVKESIRVRTKKAFLESNLKAFDLGFTAANQT